METTISIKKNTVFHNENDRIGLFIFIPFDHKSCQSYQIGRKYQSLLQVCGTLKFFLGFFKPKLLRSHVVCYCQRVSQMAECKRENIFQPCHEKFNL